MSEGAPTPRWSGLFRGRSSRHDRPGGGWKRLLLLLLFLGFSVLAVSQFTSARGFGLTMGSGVWYWGLISAAIFSCYFYLFAMAYRIGLAIVDVETTTHHMVPVLLASIFINTVVPIGAAAGGAVFVEDSIEHGRSGARTAAGVILVLAADLATSIPFIAVGVGFMAWQGTLRPYHTVVSLLFLCFILLMVAGLWFGKAREPWLRKLLGLFQRAVNWGGRRVRRSELITNEAVRESAGQFSAAAAAIIRRPGMVAKALLLTLVMHAVNELGLYTLFLTYHQRVGIGTLTAGMGMSIAFYVIAITPQGIGAVEGIMSLLFTSMGIASETAVVVAISYRVLNVWLPLALGYFFTRRMKIFEKRRLPSAPVRPEGGPAA